MIGDKLLITDYHRKAAAIVFEKLSGMLAELAEGPLPLAVTISGESGCGKSETAAVLAELCENAGYKAVILPQDDYFIYPPRTNHNARTKDIGWVGMQEVRLDLIEQNITDIKNGVLEITKPLVIFDDDLMTEETINVEGTKVIIAEGTYTTVLQNADLRAFINRNYRQTKKSRLARARDEATDFLEKVLSIEHEIISGHRKLVQIVIPPPDEEKEG